MAKVGAEDDSGPVGVVLADGAAFELPAAVWKRCTAIKNLVDDLDDDLDGVSIPLPNLDRPVAEWLVAFTAQFPSDEVITKAFVESMRSDERKRKTPACWASDPMYTHFCATAKPCKLSKDPRIPISRLILQFNHLDASYALLCATQHMSRLIRETPKTELAKTFCLTDA